MNNEFDDIFRHAAENYPLNTGEPAWEALRQKMDQPVPLQEPPAKRKSKTFFFTLLALCICLPFVLQDLQFIHHSNQLAAVRAIEENKTGILFHENLPVNESGVSLNPASSPIAIISSGKISTSTHPVNAKERNHNFLPGDGPFNTQSAIHKNNSPITNHDPANKIKQPGNQPSGSISTGIETEKEIQGNTPTESVDNPKESKELTSPTGEKENQNTRRPKRFYVVALGGPDLSMIKMQDVKKLGFNAGVHFGYRVSQKLSVEAGILWDKKYYNSDGKYLKYNKIYSPPNTTINYLEGYCSMLEIPVQVNYVFKNTKRGEWYATAGVSSYLMQEDKYTLNVTRNGYTYNRDFAYKKPGNVMLAVANLGIGYDRELNKTISLRVQPYVKLPLKEMGTGSLPIQSTGLNLGIIKKLF